MGQALRRATGRLRSSRPVPPAEPAKNAEHRPPPTVPAEHDNPLGGQDRLGTSDPEGIPSIKDDHGALEERDPGYDAMLNKMVRTVTSKPGGKLEMGEAFIVDKYNRPLPKLRSSNADAAGSDQASVVPPGTLTAAQLQQIILLHQGKSDDEHQGGGPMEARDIAKRFNIDAAHVERIVRFVSLPPEDHNNKESQK